MIIIDKREGKIKFKEMKKGDTFLRDGKVCMKVSNVFPVSDSWNAYDFCEETLFRVSNVEEYFEPVKTALHILS